LNLINQNCQKWHQSKFAPAGSLRNEVNAYGALILGLDEERVIAPELYEAMMNNEKVIQHYILLIFTNVYLDISTLGDR